jgi:hypothetical protein
MIYANLLHIFDEICIIYIMIGKEYLYKLIIEDVVIIW